MKRFVFVMLLAFTPPLAAQDAADAAAAANPVVASVRPLYEQVRGYVIQAAEDMPEEHYGFQPTAEVRTFGELIGHIANAQYSFCAAAVGEESPNSEDIEETRTTKAELVEAVRAAFGYCDEVYAQMTDAAALETVSSFGGDRTRLWVLTFNATHDNLHYGNIVTYMRLNGLVPPSSQGSS